jgi:predicted DCC family thiol-disulfide oxidoreductase YuxK
MQNIVLFDGVCNMCSYTADFLIRIDKKKKLQFASLQSGFAKEKLKEINFTAEINSLFFFKNNTPYFYSDAIAFILIEIGGGYAYVGKLILLFPKFIRDTVYKFIANHRYQWFGKKNSCRAPEEEERERFIA